MIVEQRESECPYKDNCHFYTLPDKAPHSKALEQRFCMEWPGMCGIYKAKKQGKPVPITMWPCGDTLSQKS